MIGATNFKNKMTYQFNILKSLFELKIQCDYAAVVQCQSHNVFYAHEI